MAEISQSGGGKKDGGKVRSTKMSTKIDMTPMVDLGFLLITFFMLTTSLQKPSIMQLNMPDKTKTDEVAEVTALNTLALIPGPKSQIYYFRGDPKDPATKIGVTNYSAAGIRSVIDENNKEVSARAGKEKFVVVVFPMDKASYKNIVDLLDELAITGSDRYAIVDVPPTYIELIKKSGKYVE
jgi:biopolymer transport protein ExbD